MVASEVVRAPVKSSDARGSVCVVTENRAFGGLEVHTIGLVDALVAAGYRVELICCRHQLFDPVASSAAWSDRVRLHYVDLTMGRDIDFEFDSAAWYRTLKSIEAPLVIIPKANKSQGNIAFLRACRKHFARVCFIEHLQEIPTTLAIRKVFGIIPMGLGFWWFRDRFFKWLQTRYADHTVAVSDAVRNSLVALGAKSARITTVRNGVAWKKLARSAARETAARQRLGIEPGTFVFGMLARLRPEKGIDLALQAAGQLLTAGVDDFRLVIAGKGSELETLQALAVSLGLSRQVSFIGFVESPADIVFAFDSILFSSRLEGLPLGLLEGMAAGCIPIVTRISGMPEAVSSPDIGWVVEPESAPGLAHAMRAAMSLDEAALSTMRLRVADHVRQQFDVDDVFRRILRAFDL